MKVAYFTNQYPTVSHSFIRREIAALENVGVSVLRAASRGWDGVLVGADDIAERERTNYLLENAWTLAGAVLHALICSPRKFLSALFLAVRTSFRAERSLPYHLAYLAQACLLLRLMRRFGARHLHAHFGTNSAEVAMLARQLGGPSYSFTVHGPDEFDRPEFIALGEKIRRSAFTVAITSYARSQLYRWVESEHWSKIHVVHCGLEDGFHHGTSNAPPSVSRRLVCVGRLQARKGQILLVMAAKLVLARGLDFELVLAGDGEIRGEIEALCASLGIARNVTITGWLSGDQVRSELLRSRAMVLPSFAEGLPVVVMESMALCRPVITTYVAGVPELVRHGVDGWLVPAGSVEELADAMVDCLTRTADELSTMGQAARSRVTDRHSIAVESRKLLDLFVSHADGAAAIGE